MDYLAYLWVVAPNDGHGPGWAGSMWNLIRTFRFRFWAVPNGSLAVHEAVSTRRSGESDHRFYFYFSFEYNIKIL